MRKELEVMEDVATDSTAKLTNGGREKNCDAPGAIVEEGEGNTEGEEVSPGDKGKKKLTTQSHTNSLLNE